MKNVIIAVLLLVLVVLGYGWWRAEQARGGQTAEPASHPEKQDDGKGGPSSQAAAPSEGQAAPKEPRVIPETTEATRMPQEPPMIIEPCEAGGTFGSAIDSDGDDILIGAPVGGSEEHEVPLACVGKLTSDGVQWEAALKLDDPSMPTDYFASAVAIRSGTAVIGHVGGDSGDGPMRLFRRNAGWKPAGTIANPDPDGTELDDFGFALSFWGDTLLVTARMSSLFSEQGGALHAFEASGSSFARTQSLGSGDARVVEFGNAIAMSSQWLAVGADAAHKRGAVFLFRRGQDGNLELHASIAAPKEPSSFSFGWSIAVQGETIAIGEPQDGTDAQPYIGAVHVYKHNGDGEWLPLSVLRSPQPGAMHRFGAALGWDGETLVVGEPGADQYRGRVWRFANPLAQDAKAEPLVANTQPNSNYGECIHVAENFVLVGAPRAKRVYGFKRN